MPEQTRPFFKFSFATSFKELLGCPGEVEDGPSEEHADGAADVAQQGAEVHHDELLRHDHLRGAEVQLPGGERVGGGEDDEFYIELFFKWQNVLKKLSSFKNVIDPV